MRNLHRSVVGGMSLLAACGAVVKVTLADTVLVEELRGKSIRIERPVKSVAVFPLPIPEAMIAIDGGTERLTAINPRAKAALMSGVIGQLFPEIAAIKTDLVAGNFLPNVEEILKAKPDVVLQWDSNDGQLVAPMENAGVTVATVGSKDRAARRANISMLGKILGKEARAQSFLDWDDAVFAETTATLKAVADADRRRIVFIDGMSGNELVVFGTQQVYFDAGRLKNAATEAGLHGRRGQDRRRGPARLEAGHRFRQLLQWHHQARGHFRAPRAFRSRGGEGGAGLQDAGDRPGYRRRRRAHLSVVREDRLPRPVPD